MINLRLIKGNQTMLYHWVSEAVSVSTVLRAFGSFALSVSLEVEIPDELDSFY